jgi:thiol-disulfide isomerase/thioredoxin
VYLGIALCGVALLLALLTVRPPSDKTFPYGHVHVSGSSLPLAPTDTSDVDPAVGRRVPTVTSTDFSRRAITVTGDGHPRVLLFLAHWCPHCRREVPVVQAWIGRHGLPSDVRMVSVVTRNSPSGGNWPPDRWLEREHWTMPVAVDDRENTISNAMGQVATPFWVAIDARGRVVARETGELTPARIEALVRAARNGETGTSS